MAGDAEGELVVEMDSRLGAGEGWMDRGLCRRVIGERIWLPLSG